jgi:hydroxymethylpyrimidine pyrophosphatase-like HAD family hydrolase
MIRDADVGVAVGDSSPDAIAAADVITVSCAEHAVADLINNRLESIIESYKTHQHENRKD